MAIFRYVCYICREIIKEETRSDLFFLEVPPENDIKTHTIKKVFSRCSKCDPIFERMIRDFKNKREAEALAIQPS